MHQQASAAHSGTSSSPCARVCVYELHSTKQSSSAPVKQLGQLGQHVGHEGIGGQGHGCAECAAAGSLFSRES